MKADTCRSCVYWNQDALSPQGKKLAAGIGKCELSKQHRPEYYSDQCMTCDYGGPHLGAIPKREGKSDELAR